MSEKFNGNFIPEVIQSGNTKNFFFISKHQVQVPNEVMDIIIRIFELDSFPHKRHHKEIIFNYSKKTVLKAFEAISNYSNKSYLHIEMKLVMTNKITTNILQSVSELNFYPN